MSASRQTSSASIRLLSLVAVAVSAYLLWSDFGHPFSRLETVYVSPAGSDWSRGRSPARPVRTLSRALRCVKAGGEVVVGPGEYVERVHVVRGGSAGQPLRIRADPPGEATLTWSRSARQLAWSEANEGIYRAAVPYPVYWVSCNGESLFRVPWGGEKTLREYSGRENAYGAFVYENGVLTVWLKDGVHPRRSEIHINKVVPQPREWGEMKSANLWIESDFVSLEGLRFDFGIGASIRIWNADIVTVEDCEFQGSRCGVKARNGAKDCDSLTISRCSYNNFPQGEWDKNWLSWNEIYAAYSSNGLVSADGASVSVSRSLVTHAADGMQVSPSRSHPNQSSTVENNLLAFLTDDAFEFDGSAMNLTVTENLIVDSHVCFGISPVLCGPVNLRRNISIDCDGHTKYLSPWADASPIKNVHLSDNVLINGRPAFWNQVVPISDCSASGNLIFYESLKSPVWPPGVDASNNILVVSPVARSASRPDILAAIDEQRNHDNSESRLPNASDLFSSSYGPAWKKREPVLP